jgi:hypothetical protein
MSEEIFLIWPIGRQNLAKSNNLWDSRKTLLVGPVFSWVDCPIKHWNLEVEHSEMMVKVFK